MILPPMLSDYTRDGVKRFLPLEVSPDLRPSPWIARIIGTAAFLMTVATLVAVKG